MIQVELDESACADLPRQDRARGDHTREIVADIAYLRVGIVNVALFGDAGFATPGWVLIDAGLPGTAGVIKRAANARFGAGARPAAIVMTHAHSDHAGSLESLAEEWDVPIYAHTLEDPYLNGTAAYPPPDPGVGGGMMSALSVLFPRGPVNVSKWLRFLPVDHSVPHMPGWTWIHTPGHTPGHISLWRESDRTLIAGDAFITTNQESVYAVAVQRPELHGPPMYYTQNWDDAETSVKRLATLDPETVITGHGRAMHGEKLRRALKTLAAEFRRIAVPANGKYVHQPATAKTGSAYVCKG